MNRPRPGCEDDDEVPGDMRKGTGFRYQPTAVTVIRVENGWLVTVFFADKTKQRFIATSPEDAGKTVRGLLARPDYDWVPEIERA